jgi:ABC-type transport system substrate-binding protein
VIEPLFEWSWSKRQLVPILAESWSNPDHNTWIFKLKKGIKFHDGSDVHIGRRGALVYAHPKRS